MSPQVKPVESQPVLTPLTEAAIFLVLTVRDGAEGDVRDLLEDLPGLNRAVGFRVPDGELRCVVGIGSDLWDRLFGGPCPRDLHPLAEIVGGRHTAVSTPGDLLFHLRARRMDLCFALAAQLMKRLAGKADVVDETHGFKYFDERDLMGFVDGTENPTGAAAIEAAVISDQDPDFAGGSYVIVQKYLHNLGDWEAISVEEQERVIGRTKLDDIEFPDDVKPPNSHVALNTIVGDDGEERQIVRDNMPFGTVGKGEFGTYFIGYAADPAVTELMLQNMFVGRPPGNYDRILDFSTAITGSLFFVPSADLLDDLPPPPESNAAAPIAARTGVGVAGRRRQLVGDRKSQRECSAMNNLHRRLAPISDAAWDDLEAEATRTFSRHVAGRRVVDLITVGETAAAVNTGHLSELTPPANGVRARLRESQPLVELRVPFTVDRQSVDDVERGAKDADWQPVKDAAKSIAFAEDRLIFDGFAAAGVVGVGEASSNAPIALPADILAYPTAIAQALTSLRLVGVGGPYRLLLSADAYTTLAETTDHGYPIRDHVMRVIGSEGEVIWAPAVTGAYLLSARGGDFELYVGQDVSIGYLGHDASSIELYFQESLTFIVQTAEAGVQLMAGDRTVSL